MAQFSFDVVSDYDKAEVINAYDQAQREIQNRYDFKGTPAELEWLDGDKSGLKITGNSDWQIEAILDIFRKKLASRNQSQKIVDTSKDSITSNLKTTKEVPFVSGLDQTKAKELQKHIREALPKIKSQIQGEELRVMSPKKDELQQVMKLLQGLDIPYPLRFTNYR